MLPCGSRPRRVTPIRVVNGCPAGTDLGCKWIIYILYITPIYTCHIYIYIEVGWLDTYVSRFYRTIVSNFQPDIPVWIFGWICRWRFVNVGNGTVNTKTYEWPQFWDLLTTDHRQNFTPKYEFSWGFFVPQNFETHPNGVKKPLPRQSPHLFVLSSDLNFTDSLVACHANFRSPPPNANHQNLLIDWSS